MSSPELTLQSARGFYDAKLDLNKYMKIVKNPEIDSLIGYTQPVKGYPIIQASHTEVTGNSAVTLKRIRMKLKNGSQATLIVNANGTIIIISGKRRYQQIVRVLNELIPELRGTLYEVTNTTMTWQLHKKINLQGVAQEYGRNVEYEPDRFPALTLKLRDPLVSVKMFVNGTVIASGKNLDDIKKRVQDAVGKFLVGGSIEHQIAARRNLKGKREHMRNQRYPIVNWENNTTGHYVKPGPNRKPRRYKLPANPRLVVSKVRKAYANAGIPIPAATRRALGMSPAPSPAKSPNFVIPEGATMMNIADMMIARMNKPKVSPIKETKYEKNYSPPKQMKKGLINWNANKNGYYVKPGPGGIPKFYKIPKGIKAAKKTVLKAYKNAGVRIPNKVRTIFEINKSPSPPKANAGPKAVLTNKLHLGGKECMRYTVAELKEIMRKRGIAYSGLTKVKMCARLYGENYQPAKKEASPNFAINGVPHFILGNKIRRGGRERALTSFPLGNLRSFANKTGGHGSKMTKANLVKLLISRKKGISPPKKIPSPSPQKILNQIQEEFNKGTKSPSNNKAYKLARLALNKTPNAQEFVAAYHLAGKKYPQNFNRMLNNFQKKKAFRHIGAKANVEVL
jgi:TATA-box binding protein (TBP) (component of TFIID and TFIIIB)